MRTIRRTLAVVGIFTLTACSSDRPLSPSERVGSSFPNGELSEEEPNTSASPVRGLNETFSDGNYTSTPAWQARPASIGTSVFDASSNALRVARTNAGGSGISSNVAVATDIPVTQTTRVKFDVKVVSSSVRNGCGDYCTEFPVNVRLTIRNLDGSTAQVWYSYNDDGGCSQNFGNLVIVGRGNAPTGVWLRNEEYAIRSSLPNADVITEIQLGGSGWDFDGSYDNVSIIGIKEQFTNGDFTNNPTWTPYYTSIGSSSLTVSGAALHILRTGAGGSGQGHGLSIPANINVTSSTTVKFDVKVVYSSVPSGCGFLCTEFPAFVRLVIRKADGSTQELWYAFNDDGGHNYFDSTLIFVANGAAPTNTWLRNRQFNIRHAIPSAIRIEKIELTGNGWDYESWFDNLSITR